MLRITVSEVKDPAALGGEWRELESRAECSFFQSWRWVGTLVAERFPDPLVLRAVDSGRLVALGLFNRRASRVGSDRLWLGESGEARLDAVFVEHNGLLFERGREALLAECLRSALKGPGGSRWARTDLVMSGVGEPYLRVTRQLPASLSIEQSRPAPVIDLAGIRASGRDYLDTLSRNTRYALRRSERRYAKEGALSLQRAGSVTEAHGFLDDLATLHQATWQRRGRPGAFADPAFTRFHHALIAAAMPQGEVDLLRLTAGSQVVGYLYNFRFRGRILAYQSGFHYAEEDSHRKPGLTCHHLAAEMYLGEGLATYDFLAGGDRYKTSLGKAGETLHWLRVSPRWSVQAMRNRLRAAVGWVRR